MPDKLGVRDRPAEASYRNTLHRSRLVHVEDCSIAGSAAPPAGFEDHYQVALTYAGLFSYRNGQQNWLIDANRTLFVSPGWVFSEEHPVVGIGHAAILLNPSRELLDEICGSAGPRRSAAFKAASFPSTTRLRMLTHRILHAGVNSSALFMEECAVHALREAIFAPSFRQSRASGLVERTKQLLHSDLGERRSLHDIASKVGVSAAYLTQEFTRTEGVPLYRYQLHLRLTRALLLLPRCDDITGLALDLGFSSHSHFTSVFRNAFGLTPTAYRSAASSDQLRAQELLGERGPTRWAA